MRLNPAQLQKMGIRVLVPALLLWFSSASFLNCCAGGLGVYAQGKSSARPLDNISAAEASEDAHCSVGGSSCCEELQDASTSLSLGNLCDAHGQQSGPMPCCSPANQPAADRARRSRLSPEEHADLEPSKTGRGAMLSALYPIPKAFTAPVHDRSGTYLRDCVLLI